MSIHEPKPILVTGCYRSGTTVLEKILNMHPSVTIASQPFPILYFLVKERFNRYIGIKRRYPLDHLFMEDAYTPEEFDDFLQRHVLDIDALNEFIQRMGTYSDGLWTPEILEVLNELKPGSFFEVYAQMNQLIAQLFPSFDQQYIGAKEVMIEEFALPLIGAGSKVVFVIRDPRAMITSLNFRVRDNLTGDPRPVLYSLRAWRKGVAIAITASQRGGGYMIRYEDLVMEEQATLKRLTDFLAISPYTSNTFINGITDQYGKPWSGNSSFSDKQGISRNSLDTYLERLSRPVQNFIEAVCKPEMLLLGYEVRGSLFEHQLAFSEYRDPFEYIHKSFPTDYSSDPTRLKAERKRLCMLQDGLSDYAEQRKWFVTTEAYTALKAIHSNSR